MDLTRRLSGEKESERFERVTIKHRPFRVSHTDFYREDVESVPAGIRTTTYATQNFHVHQDADKKETLIEFSAEFVPLTSIALLTNSTNCSRTASLQELHKLDPRNSKNYRGGAVGKKEGQTVNNDGTAWSTIISATLSRFSFEATEKDDLTIRFPERREEKYRVVLDNRNSPPLAIHGVTAEGPIYQLVFMGTPGQALTLDYGSTTKDRLEFDTAAVHKLLAAGQAPTVVALAEPVENPIAAPSVRWTSWLQDSRLLIAPLAVLVALLAFGLYRANQRLQTPTSP